MSPSKPTSQALWHALALLLSNEPATLAGHAQAYAELLGWELGLAERALRRRFVLHAVAMCSLSLAIGLIGVALLLWAVTPPLQIHAPWVLVCVPLAPMTMGLLCLRAAGSRRSSEAALFANVRQQWALDRAILLEPRADA